MEQVPPPPPPSSQPGLQVDRPVPRPKVDLSTTSLILIAIIVGVCTGSGNRSNNREIEELQAQVTRLEKKIDALSTAQKPRQPASAPSSAAATPAR